VLGIASGKDAVVVIPAGRVADVNVGVAAELVLALTSAVKLLLG
jgi:hypothetical protein